MTENVNVTGTFVAWLLESHPSVYPPTPADARGSALGNNTYDPGFGLVPLLYSIG